MSPLILSSTSPARKILLARLGLPFDTIAPDIDETPFIDESPETMVKRLAEAKARIHAQLFPNALIIGCDQTIVLENRMLGKPGTHENAVKQLSLSSGKKLVSFTGLCLLNTNTNHLQMAVVPYYVYLRQLTASMIENYLQQDKPYQCAGSIKAEGLGSVLFERLEGDDPTALTGLPLIALIKMLENEAINIV